MFRVRLWAEQQTTHTQQPKGHSTVPQPLVINAMGPTAHHPDSFWWWSRHRPQIMHTEYLKTVQHLHCANTSQLSCEESSAPTKSPCNYILNDISSVYATDFWRAQGHTEFSGEGRWKEKGARIRMYTCAPEKEMGGQITKTGSTAKLQFSSLASINMKPDNSTSGKKKCKGGKKKSISVILSKGNKTSWHTVLFVETAPGYMPQSISHVEGGLRKTFVPFYSLM